MSLGDRWTWSLVLIGAIAILVLVWVYQLARAPDHDAHVRDIVARLQARTLVRGGESEGEIDVERKATSIRAVWVVQADQGWDEYRRSVIQQFPDFKLHSDDVGKLVFVKHVPGDSYRVTLELISSQPLQVRATFLGYPS